jgi:hypothetical protein
MITISYSEPYVDCSTCLAATYAACSLIELCQIVVALVRDSSCSPDQESHTHSTHCLTSTPEVSNYHFIHSSIQKIKLCALLYELSLSKKYSKETLGLLKGIVERERRESAPGLKIS